MTNRIEKVVFSQSVYERFGFASVQKGLIILTLHPPCDRWIVQEVILRHGVNVILEHFSTGRTSTISLAALLYGYQPETSAKLIERIERQVLGSTDDDDRVVIGHATLEGAAYLRCLVHVPLWQGIMPETVSMLLNLDS